MKMRRMNYLQTNNKHKKLKETTNFIENNKNRCLLTVCSVDREKQTFTLCISKSWRKKTKKKKKITM